MTDPAGSRHQRLVRGALPLLLAACGDHPAAEPDAGIPREQVALVPVVESNDVDVLFVIDDSVAGFLRDGAGLAIIVFTDEDDCSFAHATFLSATDPTLGPLSSFRGTQFGVLCEEDGATTDDMAVPGTKGGCASNEASPYVMPLAGYAAFLRGLKTDPRTVLMSPISGAPTPFDVVLTTPPGGGSEQRPRVATVCSPFDAINPSVRVAQLPRMFERGDYESICTTDLAVPLTSIARQIRGLTDDACLTRDIALPADCEVADQTLAGETVLPPCSAATPTDCYQLVEDPACTTSTHLRVEVTRSAAPAAVAMVAVGCTLAGVG